MKEKLLEIKDESMKLLTKANTIKEIDELKVKYLGKKGELTQILKGMKDLSKEERPIMGALANEVREDIERSIEKKKAEINDKILEKKLHDERIDVTLKTDDIFLGHRHPLKKTLEDLEDLFTHMGFTVYDGPEIETVKNNFDLLNAPKDHPSRDMSDTFYFDENTILRSQTSPVQIRAMKEHGAPIRMICSGRVFRSDEVDATHSPMFHQLEGLVVDEKISVANLIDTLNYFVKSFFGEDMSTRFRPHYFPFTEPSLEVDTTCPNCGGKGCKSCNYTGWSMELLGCGMVHPNVLKNCGIDPEKYSGFAFGMGIDRIAMVRYKITDIRMMFENNKKFLEQF
ncbi:phenylalanine--tRNA ligase subunit alpha [Peptoniphilus porci]|uniref:Phenylalanine--tRNA ligase alpha subunit n=1 Tax=Peptoniphilus porci TaxID=2652280 RepID=A0A1U7LYR6_9FIRM|nr:phenylalanine--tRNA ligase subunit alpha [Peptoniphilus porci]OLR64571.1 phenylalanine--tRNA ligase subunit alpha [Peptoniphilus porci]